MPAVMSASVTRLLALQAGADGVAWRVGPGRSSVSNNEMHQRNKLFVIACGSLW